MKRLCTIVFGGLLLGLAGCASTSQTKFVKPGKLMEDKIQERLAQVPYQHGEELLNNMLWLTQLGEQAIPYLAKALDSNVPKQRSSAAWILGRIGDRRAIPMLQRVKNDRNQIVRLEVARSLLMLGDWGEVGQLIHGLDSELQVVRYLCYEALTSVTGKSFGYDHRASDPVDREVALGKWQDWWKDRQGEPWFKSTGGRSGIGQPAAPGSGR